jgi:hypothetical protein
MTIMNNVFLGQVFEIHDSYAHLIAFYNTILYTYFFITSLKMIFVKINKME